MVATSLVSIERRPRTGSSLLSNSRRTKIGPNDVLIATAAISIEGGDLINRRLIPPVSRRGLSDTRPRDGSWRSVRTSATAKSGTRSLPSTCRGHTLNFGRYRQTTHGSCHPAWILRLLQPCLSRLVPLTIAFFAKGGLRSGETVLIQGASGGVGLAAVQLASRAGARVIAISSGERRLQKISLLGADHVIDRSSGDVVDAVKQITKGKGVDLVVDPVGATLPTSLTTMAHEGRLVFVGNAGGGSLSLDLWPAMQSNQTLHGVFMGPLLGRCHVRSTIDDLFDRYRQG